MPRDIPTHEAPPSEDESADVPADNAPEAEATDQLTADSDGDRTTDAGPAGEQAADDEEVAEEEPADGEEKPADDEAAPESPRERTGATETAGRQAVEHTVDPPEPVADAEPADGEEPARDEAPGTADIEADTDDSDGEESGNTEVDEQDEPADEAAGDGEKASADDDSEEREEDPAGEAEEEVDATDDTHDGEEEGGSDLRDVDEWQQEIEAHERDARANGRGDPPPRDLDEMEELLQLMDPDAPMSEQGRHREDDDDGWASGRDAAGAVFGGDDSDAAPASDGGGPEALPITVKGPVMVIDADSGNGADADVIPIDGWPRDQADESEDVSGDAVHANGENGSGSSTETVDPDAVIRGIKSVEEFIEEEFDGRGYPEEIVRRADEYEARGDYEGAYGVLLEYERTRAGMVSPEQPEALPSGQTPDDQRPGEDDPQPALF